MNHQIRQILNLNINNPKLGTIYFGNSYLRMIEQFDVYCYHVNGYSPEVNEKDSFNRILFDGCKEPALDNFETMDCLISFEGTLHYDMLRKVQQNLKIPLINYDLNYAVNPFDDKGYLARKHDLVYRLYPSEGFKKKVNGKGGVLFPPLKYEESYLQIKERKNPLLTIGNFLIENEISTNFACWRGISNAINSQVFGCNPRMGTPIPSYKELIGIYNNSKIYVNTRIAGEFPIEMLEAMSYGCIVITFPYPGIEDFIGEGLNKVVNSVEECRNQIANILSSKALDEQSLQNRQFIRENKTSLGTVIKEAIGDYREGK